MSTHDEQAPAGDAKEKADARPAEVPRQRTPEKSAAPPSRTTADADRPGASFRPILSERRLKRFDAINNRPRVRGHVAIVVVTQRGDIVAFAPDGRPTIGELFWKGTTTVYEVDMGKHWTRIEVAVPSALEAVSFRAVVDVEWRVRRPEVIVRDGVHDVRESLTPHLRQRLSSATRSFGVTRAAEAEAAAVQVLAGLGEYYGLETACFVDLRMDERSLAHAGAMQTVGHEIELEELQQRLRLQRDDSSDVLISRRLERYRRILIAGDVDQFALQLAQNPDEVPQVVEVLRQERHANRRAVSDFVTHMLDSGAIDRHVVSEKVWEAVTWLKDATDTVLTGPETTHRDAIPSGSSDTPTPDLPPHDLPEPPIPPSSS